MRRLWSLASMLVGLSAPTVAQEGSLAILRAAAQNGDLASQIALADAPRGTGEDLGGYDAAAEWYRAAAEAGVAEAQLELGKLILHGAVAQPPAAGIAWLQQAAGDSPEAAFELGMAYEYGRGTEADPIRASELYRDAADGDFGAAATRLGQLLESGALGNADPHAAVDHYEQAAVLGDAAGTFALGRAYEFGLGPLEPDQTLALEHYQTASQLGSGDASYRIGEIFEASDVVDVDYEAAFSAYSLAAVQGRVDAHVARGRMFEEGRGTEQSPIRALREYKAAYELGSEAGTVAYRRLRDQLLAEDAEGNFVQVPVLFATDRTAREQGEIDPRFFGNAPDPDSLVHTGSLLVRIAVDPDQAASRDRRRFRSNGSTAAEDIDEASLVLFDQAGFQRAVQQRVGDFDHRILVFVHGFWNSFEDAVAAAAQLAWDIELPALPVVFSWPSRDQGCFGCYYGDQEYAQLSATRLAALLETVRAAAPNSEINVLAHSMGNRVLVFSADDLDPSIAIAELVMAAPDVPIVVLTDRRQAAKPTRIEKLHALSARISLYAARWDRALEFAAEIDKHKRAGSVGDDDIPAFVSNQAQTLDATAVRDWLGHSYIYTSASVMDDLQTIIAEHAQPAEPPRIWLEGRSLPPDYWAFD